MMAISERQLETWSHQGSTVQSAATYAAIKSVLEDKNAPYAGRDFEIFLQGSYANDTNIHAESDVDIVMCLTEVYTADTSNLQPHEKAEYEANRKGVTYGLDQFKRDVLAWLTHKFGPGVKAGKKAIFVPGGNSRRDADVLVCIEHQRFTSYTSRLHNRYHQGICFWMADGTMIINFPKQHRDNCTTKHQSTQSRLKPNVRVLKNMRNAMVNDGYLRDGVAPSYFLEGMLWNVPGQKFTSTYRQTIENYLDWLERCDPTELVCANGLHWLIWDGVPVCWNMMDFQTFLRAVRVYWSSSGR